jgi:Sulfotransferase family
MILSHKHKFIFVKTFKTAGTSIEIFLSQHCGQLDIVTPILPEVESHTPRNHEGYYNHMPAFEIRDRIDPNIWNSYFKFCVERNPWEKTLSWYYMKKFREDKELTLDRYLAGNKDFPINYQKYTEPNSPKIIVDRVLQYENLIEHLGKVFHELGIPFQGSLGVSAKSEYRTDRRHYREVFTPEQSKRVAYLYRHEIFLHGYKF